MKPITAICFLLVGASLVLLGRQSPNSEKITSAQVCAAIVLLIATATLCEWITGQSLGIDHWLFAESLARVGDSGRMAALTAFNFILVCVAVLGLEWKTKSGQRPALYLPIPGLISCYLVSASFLYGAHPPADSGMAFSSAALLFLIHLKVFTSREVEGPLSLTRGRSAGSKVAGGLVPLAAALPVVVGWLRLQGEKSGWYGLEFGLALFTTFNVTISVGLIWLAGLGLNRYERNRQQLEDERAELWSVLDESQNQILIYDDQTLKVIYANSGAQKMLGLDAGQLSAQTFEQLKPGFALESLAELRANPGHRLVTSYSQPGASQQEFPCEVQLQFVQHPGRAYFLEVSADVSSRSLAQQAAREHQQDFRTLAESIPKLVWTCRPDGSYDYLSPQWHQYSGVPVESLLEGGWMQLLADEDRSKYLHDWHVASEQRQIFLTTVRLRSREGEWRWFQCSAQPVLNDGGEATRWVGSNTDVQDIEQSRLQLEVANHDLEQRVQERTGLLVESNRRLAGLANQLQEAQRIANLGSWSLEIDSGKVTWSPELYRIVGRDAAEEAPNYHSQSEMFTPDSWKSLTEAVQAALQEGKPYELELEILRPDGRPCWAVARGAPVQGEGGSAARLVGTLQDVTDMKVISLELERLGERARLATSSAGIGIWDWNVSDDRLSWDDTMLQLYGLTREEFSGSAQDWSNSLHPDDQEEANLLLGCALRGEAVFETSFRILRQGQVRHLSAAAVVHFDSLGKACRAVGVNWDITDKREAEASLRQSEGLLRDFIRYTPAAIAMLDEQMRYLEASEQWIRDYKLEGQEILGRSHYEVFPDIPQRWKDIHQRVLLGAVEQCSEDPFPRADGGVEWLQWEARPWRKGDDSIGGLIFFTQVITSRKEMETKILAQKSELERSNRELEQFAYIASHDLQEPLRAVAGCGQILQRRYQDKLEGPGVELIGHIVEGAKRMETLILDLLTYSRVSSRGAEMLAIDLNEPMHKALRLLDGSLRAAGGVCRVEDLPCVRGDEVQLQQLFQNLVANAIKYRSSRPLEIEICCRRDESCWEFSVGDNGIGIEEQYFERIFVLFQRLHTRKDYPGTGIGLALCAKIVERHGGTIWVRSVHGEGSKFFFTLPAGVE